MAKTLTFPDLTWQTRVPEAAGMDPSYLADAHMLLDSEAAGNRPYRAIIVRDGCVVAAWNRGYQPDARLGIASAAKSIFACVLGAVVAEGRLPSVDARVIDYYPAAFAVGPNEGPKPGRYAFEKDRSITFRQLISNTSGYMKPDEQPGKVFHYQTYGMNILTHALATIYGLYDLNDPEGSPGFRKLIDRFIRDPISATWTYESNNFYLRPQAALNVFGYYDGVRSTALDLARLGWLWCCHGRWQDQQLIPEAWLHEATRTAPAIRDHAPESQWCYGYGFWTNDYGLLYPDLPHTCFMASGAGNHTILVEPVSRLVVVQSPSPWKRDAPPFAALLRLIYESIESD